jgi:hypothetical protein
MRIDARSYTPALGADQRKQVMILAARFAATNAEFRAETTLICWRLET